MSSSFIGRKLGQYKITELIGKGGMATVYKGYQESIDRHVAIKVLPPHPGLDDEFIERFKLEAKTIGGLQHPHILPLYDYGTEDNVLYLAMAFIDGGSLEDLIGQGPMQPRRVEKILREVASAMDYAHRRGIIHRDIKPGNILIDGEGHALLADFGIVKMTGSEGGGLTGTNIVGTPAYMAPEQGQGMAIDGRADIYALGVVVYEMLTGHQPYSAETPMQVVLKHITDAPPNIREDREDLPESIQWVMDKVLAKDPRERYQSAVEFAEDFSKAIHRNIDSLTAVQKEFPLDQNETPTEIQPVPQWDNQTSQQPQTGINNTQVQDSQPQAQTIIMRESTNPLVLLAGFGLIAVVIVVVAVLLTNSNSTSETPPPTNIAEDANNETATANALAAETEEPDTPTPTDEPESNFGELRFNTVNAPGDKVDVTLKGLRQPGAGMTYAAWLFNTNSEETLSLGPVNVDAFGETVLTYTDEDGRLLPAHFNAIIITEEETIGETPVGGIIYQGELPIEVTEALSEIFVASDDGIDGGSLLDGAKLEASVAAQHAGLAANATNIGGMRSHIEHTINILLGTADDYTGDNRGVNPGKGIGIYIFLDAINAHVDAAVTAPNASVDLQGNAETIRVCVENVRGWSDRVIELEKEMLAEEEDVANVEPQAAESQTLTAALQSGIDFNENGVVEPFEGECGLDQIREYGFQVGNMIIYDMTEDE